MLHSTMQKHFECFFFAIVKSVNEHFSVARLETFFKNATKNAKKTSETKGLRQLSIHHRGRRLNVAAFERAHFKQGIIKI